MATKNPDTFRNDVIGKCYDYDGYFGAQCWDGWAEFTRRYYGRVWNCPITGYAIDVWNLRNTNGVKQYFEIITDINKLKEGDWLFWKRAAATPGSHVAQFRKYVPNYLYVLGQNQGGPYNAKRSNNGKGQMVAGQGSGFNERSITRSGFAGALRPKFYIAAKPAPKPTPKPTPKPKPSTGGDFKVIKTLKGYKNSVDAMSGKHSNSTVSPGKYYTFSKASNGARNITKKKGTPGWWINPKKNVESDNKTVSYKVKQGDNLSSIANHYKTSVSQLVKWNSGKYPSLKRNPSAIDIGWTLRVK